MSVGAPGAGATPASVEPRLLSFTLSAPASGVSTQSTNAWAAGRFFAPFTMLTAPTSNPVSFGTVRSTGLPFPFSVRMSWLQLGAPAASPLEMEVMTPGEVAPYERMLAWSFFM